MGVPLRLAPRLGSARAAPELVYRGEGAGVLVLEAIPAGQVQLGAGLWKAGAELLQHGRRNLKAEEAQVERLQRRGQTRDGEAMLLDVHREIAEAALREEVAEAAHTGGGMIGREIEDASAGGSDAVRGRGD